MCQAQILTVDSFVVLTLFCFGPRTSWGLEILSRIDNIEIEKLN